MNIGGMDYWEPSWGLAAINWMSKKCRIFGKPVCKSLPSNAAYLTGMSSKLNIIKCKLSTSHLMS